MGPLEIIHVDFHDKTHHDDCFFNIFLKIMRFFIKILTLKYEVSIFWGALVVEISDGSHFLDLHIFKCSETEFHGYLSKIRGAIVLNT